MFTVIIAEKEHIDAIRQENKLFFEPFLENKELAFCYWNPMGQNLEDSVPGLLDTVGHCKNWRAVIVNSHDERSLKLQNPFDVVDCSALTSLNEPNAQPEEKETFGTWHTEWKEYYQKLIDIKQNIYESALSNPLQKLTTWLCYKPEDYILNEVQQKLDVHEWALEEISRDQGDVKPRVQLEVLEKNHYKNELRIKDNIRRKFTEKNPLNIAHPSEVHCIAIRTADKSFFDPDDFWSIKGENEYSTFNDRNMYFDKMRFMVFDLLSETHRNFRTDYIRFLAALLIFASNPLPTSAMQARHLYRLETETNDDPLCTLVTSYDRKLAATSEVIDSEMEQIRCQIPGELTDKAAQALFCNSKEVPVILDGSCEPERVIASTDYGLFFDSPENEFYKWNRDYSTSEKALSYIVKQQSRSVRKSVSQMHMASDIIDVNVSRLTPLQVDDVRDYSDVAENEMVDSIPPDLSDLSAYTQRMSKESEKVKKVLKQRMTKKTTLILGAVCLGLYLICFLPFLFSNNGSPKTVSTAIVLTGVVLAVMAAILLASLYFLRLSILNAVKGFNNTAREVLNDIQSSMKKFSKYLGYCCTVRRGHAVQNYASKNLDEYTKLLRIRRKHQEDIRKRRAYLKEFYGDYFGGRSFCDEIMSRPYDYDFDIKTEYNYPAPFLAGDCRQIEFISSGNYVTVPSSYVTKIMVKMEGIYEK